MIEKRDMDEIDRFINSIERIVSEASCSKDVEGVENVIEYLKEVGSLLRENGMLKKAIHVCDHTIDIHMTCYGHCHPANAAILILLGDLFYERFKILKSSCTWEERENLRGIPSRFRCLHGTLEFQDLQRQNQQKISDAVCSAKKSYNEALMITKFNYGDEDKALISIYKKLGSLLWDTESYDVAVNEWAAAIELIQPQVFSSIFVSKLSTYERGLYFQSLIEDYGTMISSS